MCALVDTMPRVALADRQLDGADDVLQSSLEPSLLSRWYVLYVRSRQEKVLAEDLSARGIAHYLPLVRQKKYYGKRRFDVELPLFPGYVFLKGSVDDVYLADRTKRVTCIIPVQDQSRLEWELRNIRLALSRDAVLRPYPKVVVGTRVEIRSGPFTGLCGVVEQFRKHERLILQVKILGQASSLDLDGAEVAPLD